MQGQQRTMSRSTAESVAKGLGWFSIGLGAAEVLMPKTVAHTLGMPGRENLVRAYGARELAAGVGILISDNKSAWIWGRVAGDAIDLAILAARFNDRNPRKRNVGLAMAAVAGAMAVDIACAQALAAEAQPPQQTGYDAERIREAIPQSVSAHAM